MSEAIKEIDQVEAAKMVKDLLRGAHHGMIMQILARAWEAGWGSCAEGGKAHYNPFGDP